MINDLVAWYKEDKRQIWWTVAGAVLSTVLALVCENMSFFKGNISDFKFILTGKAEYGVQSVFIIIAIVIVLGNLRSTLHDLSNRNQITDYMVDNCNIKIFKEEDKSMRHRIVIRTTWQFYILWLVVWSLWLCYYLGNFMFEIVFSDYMDLKTKPAISMNIMLARTIYSQVFDFLSSTALLGLYLVLAEATVGWRRTEGGISRLWNGAIVMLIFTILFVVGLIYEVICINKGIHPNVVSISLSVFSAVAFVLMLGKINSNYMRIPTVFLMMMYLYAIIQCYVPFKDIDGITMHIFNLLLPYITLMGKVFVLLSLCWITYRKRLIFFIIHRGPAIDNIPRMLLELNHDIARY